MNVQVLKSHLNPNQKSTELPSSMHTDIDMDCNTDECLLSAVQTNYPMSNLYGYMAAATIKCLTAITLWGRNKNGCHFPDDIFKWIFLNKNVWILINISLKFVPRGPINNIPTLVQVMAWRRPGDKPLSEPMMVRLPTHICVTQPQWVNPGTAGNASARVPNTVATDVLWLRHQAISIHNAE